MKVRRTMKMKVQRFEVGDVIRFKLTDGEKVEAIAVKQVGSNMLFIHTDCLKKEYQCMMNTMRMDTVILTVQICVSI